MTEKWTIKELNEVMGKILDNSYRGICQYCNGNGNVLDVESLSLKSCKKCSGTGLCFIEQK